MQFRGGKKDERYLYILYINLSSSVGNFYRSCETRRDTCNNSFRRHFFQLFLISKFLPRYLSFTNNANLFSIGLKIRFLRAFFEKFEKQTILWNEKGFSNFVSEKFGCEQKRSKRAISRKFNGGVSRTALRRGATC